MSVTVLGAVVALWTAGMRDQGGGPFAVSAGEWSAPVPTVAPLQQAAVRRPGDCLLRRHFGLSSDDALDLRGAELGALIAMLPDPFDSHLDWAFDQALDSLRRAYESAGFVLDGFWLPWSPETRPDTESNRGLRESVPGAFLFRELDGPRLELLYIVGEVPTSGVHRKALEAALEECRALQAFGPRTEPWTLRIVGPFFSGSASSLREVLDLWLARDDSRRVDVVTGSATSARNELLLSGTKSIPRVTEDQIQAREHQGDLPWPESRIRFRATVHPDETLLAVLRKVLPDLGVSVGQVAILSESSTQYAANRAAPRDSSAAPASSGTEVEAKEPLFTIPFPMNLTSLRAAYAREWRTPGPETNPLGTGRPARVELSLEEQDRTRETPRPTSPLTEPVTDLLMNEIARTLISRQIRLVVIFATDVRDKLLLGAEIAERLPDVQLVTTESNLLYLRSDFNASLRGMLVLSTYPLFVRAPDWNAQSALVQELSFPSDPAEGIYNAALLLLGRPEVLVDYGRLIERKNATVADPSRVPSSSKQVPPVWITTVGKSSMLPVRLGQTLDETEAYPAAVALGLRSAPETQLIALLPVGLTGVLLPVLLALCLRALHAVYRESTTLGAIFARFDPGSKGKVSISKERIEAISLELHREIYEGLLILALWSVHLPCATLLLTLEGHEGWMTILLLVACLFIALLAIIGSGIRTWRAFSIARHFSAEGICFVCCGVFDRPAERLMWVLENVARFLVVVLGVLYVALSLAYALGVHGLAKEPTAFELFFHRAVLVEEGVSPLTPLLLIGICLAVWCFWHLRRIALLGTIKPIEALEKHHGSGVSAPAHREMCAGGITACLRVGGKNVGSALLGCVKGSSRRPDRTADVRNRLFRVVPDTRALGLLLFMTITGVVLYFQLEPGLEHLVFVGSGPRMSPFDALLAAGILALLFTTAWAAYRLVVVWLALRAYLRQHEGEALQRAWVTLGSALAKMASLGLWALGSGPNLQTLLEPRWRALIEPGPGCPDRRLESWSTGGSWRQMKADPDAYSARLGELSEQITIAQGERCTASAGVARQDGGTADVGAWLGLAHETLALELVDWIEWVMKQLRTLAMFLLVSLLLTTALLSCYPFHPQSLFRQAFLFLLVGTSASFLFVILEMNRNPVLSRITGTDPGRLTWDRTLVTNLLLFGALPLVALTSSQVPAVRDVLFAWADPLLKAVLHS